MPDIQHELRPLVVKLRAKYPHVEIVEACLMESGDGIRQQRISYLAPMELLKQAGLVTDEMLALQSRPDLRSYNTSLGEEFTLFKYDNKLVENIYLLQVYTGETPREYLRKDMSEARRVIKKIARAARVTR